LISAILKDINSIFISYVPGLTSISNSPLGLVIPPATGFGLFGSKRLL
jgi:hypothetical protein